MGKPLQILARERNCTAAEDSSQTIRAEEEGRQAFEEEPRRAEVGARKANFGERRQSQVGTGNSLSFIAVKIPLLT